MTAGSCAACGRALEPRPSVVEAEHGSVRSQVEGIELLVCPEGHEERPADPEQTAAVVARMRDGLLLSARSRLPWRPERCGACGEPLTMPGRRTTRSVTITVPGGGPFTVTLDLPMRRCTECAGDNLPIRAWPDVEAATRAALTHV